RGEVSSVGGGKRYPPLCVSGGGRASTPGVGLAGETCGDSRTRAARTPATPHFRRPTNCNRGICRSGCRECLHESPGPLWAVLRGARNFPSALGTVGILFIEGTAGKSA